MMLFTEDAAVWVQLSVFDGWGSILSILEEMVPEEMVMNEEEKIALACIFQLGCRLGAHWVICVNNTPGLSLQG